MSTPAIELTRLSMSYGGRQALDDVSLAVAPGDIFGYLGPNGAGKTTTLKIVAGILRPTAGDAAVLGSSVLADPLTVKSRIGYVPESGAVFERLTPREHLRFVARVRGLTAAEADERIARHAGHFQLTAELDRRCSDLSKGTKQKAAAPRTSTPRPAAAAAVRRGGGAARLPRRPHRPAGGADGAAVAAYTADRKAGKPPARRYARRLAAG